MGAGTPAIVLRTVDGGASWTPQNSGTSAFLNAVSFVDASNGWAVGENGVIVHTADAGATWTPQASGVNVSLYGVLFADLQHGIIVGQLGTVLRTSDGGESWTKQVSRTSQHLRSVFHADVNTATIVGDFGIILHTTSGGEVVSNAEPPPGIPRAGMDIQLFPNPTRGPMTINFEVESASHTAVRIYDVLGREVTTLADTFLFPGPHTLTWSTFGVASGVYFARVETGGTTGVARVVVNR